MGIIDRIEERVVLPDDGELARSRKTLATTVLFASVVATAINALSLLFVGLPASALAYGLFVLTSLVAGLLVLAFPRRLPLIVKSFLLISIGFVTWFQFGLGGYSSGVYSMPWAILGPLGAVLLVGSGFTLVSLAVFALALLSMVLLEPLAAANGPAIDTAVLLGLNTSSLAFLCLMVTLASLYLLYQVERYRARANALLLNMLPEAIAARLKDRPQTIAEAYECVTVLFADMVGSTPLFAELEPAEAVDWLNEVFSTFDRLVRQHGLEKIRTIGDNYMVACGVPEARADHAQAMAAFALDMVAALEAMPPRQGKRMAFRVGMNSGPLVAGVIGVAKYQYDLWGDTVNLASRMESHGQPGKVHLSAATHALIKDEFDCVRREALLVKGKGEMETWFLVGKK